MSSAGTAVTYYQSSYAASADPQSPAAAADAVRQTTCAMASNSLGVSGSSSITTLPTAAAALANSFNCAPTGSISTDHPGAKSYGQSRWW